MAQILVAYGTTEGQTRKIAGYVVDQLRRAGHEVRLYDSSENPGDLIIGDFDAVIVIGSIHFKAHSEPVTIFARAHRQQLQAKPTLFISVSLSAAFPETRPEAQSYVDRFVEETGWQPHQTCLVAGALRYSQYGFYEEEIVEHIVLKGREAGEFGHDHEFTDWEALSAEVESFTRLLGE